MRSADPDIAIVLPLLEQIKRGDSACAPPALSPRRVRVCVPVVPLGGAEWARGAAWVCACISLSLCVCVCV
jgi:hypothetical protein